MQSHTIVLAVAVLAVPLALAGLPDNTAKASDAEPATFPKPAVWDLTQNDQGFRTTLNGRALEPAPVPSSLDAGVSPVDRAGSSESPTVGAGPVNATPFSGTPDSERSSGSPNDRAEPQAGDTNVTPDLGK